MHCLAKIDATCLCISSHVPKIINEKVHDFVLLKFKKYTRFFFKDWLKILRIFKIQNVKQTTKACAALKSKSVASILTDRVYI